MPVTPVSPASAPAAATPEARGRRAALRWLFSFVRPHTARLVVVLGLSLASTVLGLGQPLVTKFLIDDGLIGRNFRLVVALSGLTLLLGLTAALLGAANRWQYIETSGRILFALREAVYRHLQRLSPAFHARATAGDLLARLDGDIAEIQRFAVDGPLAAINGAIALGGALAVMAWLHWPLACLALGLLPAEFLFLRAMRPRVEARTRTVRERAGAITGFLVDTLSAMKLVQAVAAEEREARRLEGLNAAYLRDLLRLQLTSFVAAVVPNLLASLGAAAVFVVGGYLVVEGRLSLGTLVAFSVYLGRSTGPLQTLLGLYVATARARVSLERVRALTEVAPAVVPPVRPRRLPPGAAGEVRFEGVAFRYGPGEPLLLTDLSAVIPAGRKVAIAGASGIGKTTLIDLLHRHYDPGAGRILLDGVDLRELDLPELRRRVAVVAQDTALLPGTIADNIRYAAPEASDAAVGEAAARAGMLELAAAFPRELETEVGQRGSRLSGGQRQRVALARALLLDPLILVLDEATSAVDEPTQRRIAETIDAVFGDRTRLVISHHPAPVAGADVAFELRDGRLWPAVPAAATSG